MGIIALYINQDIDILVLVGSMFPSSYSHILLHTSYAEMIRANESGTISAAISEPSGPIRMGNRHPDSAPSLSINSSIHRGLDLLGGVVGIILLHRLQLEPEPPSGAAGCSR